MTVHMALIITSRMLKDWVIYCLGGDYFMNCNFCWVLPLSLWDLLHLLPFIKVKVRHVVTAVNLRLGEQIQPVLGVGARARVF